MNVKPAPAPWTVGGRYQYRTVLLDANGNSIASGGNNRTIVGEQLEASLRLAAAAPDLLAALREIESAARLFPYAGVTCGEIASSAIAKLGA